MAPKLSMRLIHKARAMPDLKSTIFAEVLGVERDLNAIACPRFALSATGDPSATNLPGTADKEPTPESRPCHPPAASGVLGCQRARPGKRVGLIGDSGTRVSTSPELYHVTIGLFRDATKSNKLFPRCDAATNHTRSVASPPRSTAQLTSLCTGPQCQTASRTAPTSFCASA